MRKKIEIDENKIIRFYNDEYMSYKDIGEEINCSPSTVKRLLVKNGVKLRTQKETKRLKKEKFGINWLMRLPLDDIRFLFEEKRYSIQEVAKIMDCSRDFIGDLIKENNIIPPSVSEISKRQYKTGRKVNGKIYDIPSKEDIVFLYMEKRLSLNKISKIFDTSIPTLNKWISLYKIETDNGENDESINVEKVDVKEIDRENEKTFNKENIFKQKYFYAEDIECFHINIDSLIFLNEKRLGQVLSKLYPNHIFIHDKIVPNSGINNRPDYRCDELKLIVEFDGYRHFSSPKVILSDNKKDKVYKNMGYTVIRIPYFIQLDTKTVKYFFNIDNYSSNERIYPHGFIDKNAMFPAEFCSLGIEKFMKYFVLFIDNLKGDTRIFNEGVFFNNVKYLLNERKLNKYEIFPLQILDMGIINNMIDNIIG